MTDRYPFDSIGRKLADGVRQSIAIGSADSAYVYARLAGRHATVFTVYRHHQFLGFYRLETLRAFLRESLPVEYSDRIDAATLGEIRGYGPGSSDTLAAIACESEWCAVHVDGEDASTRMYYETDGRTIRQATR